MARPTTKTALLEAAQGQYEKLVELVGSMTAEEQQSTFDFSGDPRKKEAHWGRDRCLRDVLIHLYEWHQLLLDWVDENQDGRPTPFLPEPYTWKTYGQMNVQLWRKHQSTCLEEATQLLRSSHARVLALIEQFTDEDLFAKGRFPWTGGTTLGSYCVSTTSSHYDWAMKKIRAHLRVARSRG